VWKWLLGALAALALLCGGGGYLVASSDKGKDILRFMKHESKPTEVRLDPVERGQVIRVVSAPGTVEPKTKVQISAQVVARIVALPFREGDQVKKGDVVARLDAEDLVASLESTRAALHAEEARLEGLRADLANAEAELGRTRGLYDTKDVSKSALDAAESAYLRAKSAVKQSQHGIEIARANIVRAQKDLDHTVIISPMDGTLTKRNAEVGELVVIGTLNNPGSVILEIADLATMLVKAKVDEANIAPVRAGQNAKIFVSAYPDRTFAGTVDLVGLKKELDKDGTGYFLTEVLIHQEAGDRLRSGLTASVEMEVETFSSVLKVPSQAIVDRRVDELPREVVDGSANVDKTKTFARVVYSMKEGKARAIPVNIGSSDTTHTVIVAGVGEGERVITGPYKVLAALRNDQEIAEQPAKPAPPKNETPSTNTVADKPAANGKS
jgi:HlyD family secretion protein